MNTEQCIRIIRATPKHPAFSAIFVLVALFGCTTGPPPPPSPLQLAGLDAKILLVTPMNIVSPLPTKLEGSTKIVSNAIRAHLETHGKTVANLGARAGHELWLQSTRAVREAGQPRNFENGATIFAAKVRDLTDYDVLIIPSIYIQNTKGSLERASKWDGTKQRLNMIGRMKNNQYNDIPPWMNVKAASLHIAVVDRNGTVLHSKRAGLELIQHVAIIREKNFDWNVYGWELQFNDPVIVDEQRLRDGVARALSPFLSAEPPIAVPLQTTEPKQGIVDASQS